MSSHFGKLISINPQNDARKGDACVAPTDMLENHLYFKWGRTIATEYCNSFKIQTGETGKIFHDRV